MKGRTLLIFCLALLVLPQFVLAQTASTVQQLAVVARSVPHGLPVVPAKSVAAGHARPTVWVADYVGKPLVQPNLPVKPNLPSFCNVTNSRGGFNWCPNALQIAYDVNNIVAANGGAGMTIAIVDAFHYKNVESDLAFFNSEMGLPACTKASGCFSNLDQNGNDASTTTCASNGGWELETMLDVEWAHVMAPNAHIMLVEGCTNSFDDLAAAVQTAVSKGADVVSNSYGAGEFAGESTLDSQYFHAVPILFSSGDDAAAGKSYPCASSNVTCVGGTRLMPKSSTDFHRGTETGWVDSGGGCAIAEEPVPSWQSNNGVGLCGATRNMPDIAAVGDPDTGVIVYDSGNGGHFRVGGTSVSCPLMAGLFADLDTARTTVVPSFLRKPKLAGSASANFVNIGLYLKYAGHNTGNPYVFYYFDVIGGNNGFDAIAGYDLVTGLGVLNGTHAGPPWNLP